VRYADGHDWIERRMRMKMTMQMDEGEMGMGLERWTWTWLMEQKQHWQSMAGWREQVGIDVCLRILLAIPVAAVGMDERHAASSIGAVHPIDQHSSRLQYSSVDVGLLAVALSHRSLSVSEIVRRLMV